MAYSFEDAATFLPKYLSPAGRRELFAELESLPKTYSYYAVNDGEELLQGDGWNRVDFLDVDITQWRQLRAVMVSNTCDVATENARDIPIRVTDSPLIAVHRFVDLLLSHGVPAEDVGEKLKAIRRQEITNVFYFPKSDAMDDEYVVFFDNVQSYLPAKFHANTAKQRLFSLNQAGFWYFLLKLSIHFCRANEGVVRGTGK